MILPDDMKNMSIAQLANRIINEAIDEGVNETNVGDPSLYKACLQKCIDYEFDDDMQDAIMDDIKKNYLMVE